jgi:hypothetical protein
MRDKGHFDSAHDVGDALSSRSARGGVALAVGAEKGVAQLDADVVLDDLDRADRNAANEQADKHAPTSRAVREPQLQPQPKRKRADVADADDDVDDKVMVSESESESEQKNGKVDELVAKHTQQIQHERRSKDKQPRTAKSAWLTLGAVAVSVAGDNRKVAVCYVCDTSVLLNVGGSSSNLKQHYHSRHQVLHDNVQKAIADRVNKDVLRAMFVNEKNKASASAKNKNGDIRTAFSPLRPAGGAAASQSGAKQMEAKKVNRTSQILYAAASDTPLSGLGSPLHAAYVASLGGAIVDESETGLLDMLPQVYAAVEDLTCQTSAIAKVGSIAVDGWSSAMSLPIMGMTVSFVDASWQVRTIPLGLLNLEDLEKTSANQASVMSAMLRSSKRLDDSFIVHTGISDNEASIAGAVEIVTNNSGALRCLVHTLSLIMKADVLVKRHNLEGSSYIVAIIERAHAVATFVNQHPKFEARLRDDQTKVDKVTADRIRTLKIEMPTRWYSQLIVLESYVVLHNNLQRVCDGLAAGEAAPLLLDDRIHMEVAAEATTVMREVRRVGRALEAEKSVTASRLVFYGNFTKRSRIGPTRTSAQVQRASVRMETTRRC